jgi:hypothetical protein
MGLRPLPLPPDQPATYSNLTTELSLCWHAGHSKDRRSNPGLCGSMRVRSIGPEHLGHAGRSKTDGFGVCPIPAIRYSCHCGYRRERYRTLSHRRLTKGRADDVCRLAHLGTPVCTAKQNGMRQMRMLRGRPLISPILACAAGARRSGRLCFEQRACCLA